MTLEFLSGSRVVDLKKSEADLAIRMAPSEDEELVARKLGEVGWSLYASDAYLAKHRAPVDPRNLAGHEVLGFEPSLAGVPGAKWLEAHGAGANVVMRCRELVDMIAACVAGLGLAVLPSVSAELEPSLRRLTPEVLGERRRLWLVYRKEVLVAQPVKAVIELVTTIMQGYTAQMAGED